MGRGTTGAFGGLLVATANVGAAGAAETEPDPPLIDIDRAAELCIWLEEVRGILPSADARRPSD